MGRRKKKTKEPVPAFKNFGEELKEEKRIEFEEGDDSEYDDILNLCTKTTNDINISPSTKK
jgi:hypothetical protein